LYHVKWFKTNEWGTGVTGLKRKLATISHSNQEPLVVRTR